MNLFGYVFAKTGPTFKVSSVAVLLIGKEGKETEKLFFIVEFYLTKKFFFSSKSGRGNFLFKKRKRNMKNTHYFRLGLENKITPYQIVALFADFKG